MKHLTQKASGQWVFSTSIPQDDAQAVSDALAEGVAETGESVAFVFRQALLDRKAAADAALVSREALEVAARDGEVVQRIEDLIGAGYVVTLRLGLGRKDTYVEVKTKDGDLVAIGWQLALGEALGEVCAEMEQSDE